MLTHTVFLEFRQMLQNAGPRNSSRCRISRLGAHRRRLRALGATLLSLGLWAAAPQASAQCGPDITLAEAQWRMVAISCDPGGSNNTVGDVLGPSLGIVNYNTTWVAWRRVYNSPATCAVPSGPADCYQKLTVNDTLAAGDALWVYSTVEISLQYSTVANSTSGPSFTFPSPVGDNRFFMFGNPYEATVDYADLTFEGAFLGFIPLSLTTQAAANFGVINEPVFYWNGVNTYFTRNLGNPPPAATFTPKEAAWIEMEAGSGLFAGFTIRVPDPSP
ncbi:MAG: hypothetical protein AAGA91_09715 [Pseudomonadota bacterium]